VLVQLNIQYEVLRRRRRGSRVEVQLVYMALPYFFGVLTEKGRRVKGVRWLVGLWGGDYPELRAWDWFFSSRPVGIMRLKLANDEWKAGRRYQDSAGADASRRRGDDTGRLWAFVAGRRRVHQAAVGAAIAARETPADTLRTIRPEALQNRRSGR
jgi:hypothetical protein